MKQTINSKKQHGFFDFGISLIILAIGASTAAVVVSNKDETAVAKSDTVITEEAVPRHD